MSGITGAEIGGVSETLHIADARAERAEQNAPSSCTASGTAQHAYPTTSPSRRQTRAGACGRGETIRITVITDRSRNASATGPLHACRRETQHGSTAAAVLPVAVLVPMHVLQRGGDNVVVTIAALDSVRAEQ